MSSTSSFSLTNTSELSAGEKDTGQRISISETPPRGHFAPRKISEEAARISQAKETQRDMSECERAIMDQEELLRQEIEADEWMTDEDEIDELEEETLQRIKMWPWGLNEKGGIIKIATRPERDHNEIIEKWSWADEQDREIGRAKDRYITAWSNAETADSKERHCGRGLLDLWLKEAGGRDKGNRSPVEDENRVERWVQEQNK